MMYQIYEVNHLAPQWFGREENRYTKWMQVRRLKPFATLPGSYNYEGTCQVSGRSVPTVRIIFEVTDKGMPHNLLTKENIKDFLKALRPIEFDCLYKDMRRYIKGDLAPTVLMDFLKDKIEL